MKQKSIAQSSYEIKTCLAYSNIVGNLKPTPTIMITVFQLQQQLNYKSLVKVTFMRDQDSLVKLSPQRDKNYSADR